MSLSESRWASGNRSYHHYSSFRQPTTSTSTPTGSAPSTTTTTKRTCPVRTAPTTTQVTITRLDELHRFDRLLRRLRWKTELLVGSYNMMRRTPSDFLHDFSPAQAETEFKQDFFEYFSLLEKVLVHLLASLHITVSRSLVRPARTAGTDHNSSIIGTNGKISIYGHRFHANVLETLDEPTNPIHCALGVGEVRMYLGVAKDCRNKWKDAGEPGSYVGGELYPVSSLNLDKMLPCILEGFGRAREIAWTVVQAAPEQKSVIQYSQDGSIAMDVDGHGHGMAWDAGEDAMEWEGL